MSFFWTKTLEVSVVGLQASGKTSFVNVLDVGGFTEDVVPTIAFNMRKGSSLQRSPLCTRTLTTLQFDETTSLSRFGMLRVSLDCALNNESQ